MGELDFTLRSKFQVSIPLMIDDRQASANDDFGVDVLIMHHASCPNRESGIWELDSAAAKTQVTYYNATVHSAGVGEKLY